MASDGNVVTSHGAAIRSASEVVGLIAAVALPSGGMFSVDLFRPSDPYELVLSSSQMRDPELRQLAGDLAAAFQTGSVAPEVPQAWIRHAVVAGVDRWLDLRLDEDLLAADRALASALLGQPGKAAALYERATPALTALARRLLDTEPQRRPAALVGEFQRVAVGASAQVREYASQLTAEPKLRLALAAGPEDEGAGPPDIRDPWRDSTALAASDMRVARTQANRLRPLLMDPRVIPARVIARGSAPYLAAEDAIQVVCTAHPGLVATDPVSARLLYRAVRAGTGQVLARGSLAFEPGPPARFAATVGCHGAPPHDIAIEVYDLLSTGKPQSVGAFEIAATQVAFGQLRQANALRCLGAADLADTAFRMARRTLIGRSADAPSPGLGDLQRVFGVVGPTRPLLCELEQLWNHDPSATGGAGRVRR